MFSECEVYCSICRGVMDWQRRYGREACCCSRECYREFEWRRTLSVMGRAYYQDPSRGGPTVVRGCS